MHAHRAQLDLRFPTRRGMGWPPDRCGTQTRSTASRASPPPSAPRRPLPRARDREAPSGPSVLANRLARAPARAELRGRPRARRLPPGPLHATRYACASHRRIERCPCARLRDDGGRCTDRACREPDVQTPGSRPRRAFPRPDTSDTARGAQRAGLRPVERAPACAPTPDRVANRPCVVREVVRRMATPAGRRENGRRASGPAANVAPHDRMAASRTDRSGGEPGRERRRQIEIQTGARMTVLALRRASRT
jgi:hypothetical protein